MDSEKQSIIFRPTSWSCIKSNKNSGPKSLCGVFGYTNQGESIYLRIFPPEIYLLEYSNPVSDQTLTELSDQLNPNSIRRSKNNPQVAIIVDPTVHPSEIQANTDSDSGENPSIATWNSSIISPYGSLASMFKATGLYPYQWVKVERFKLNRGRPYTIAEIEISAHYNHLSATYPKIGIVPSRFFWDLEVYSSTGQFPKASNDPDEIFMGSGSHRSNSRNNDYLFHLKKLNPIGLNQQYPPVVIEMKNEGELISQMVTIHRSLRVDRSYTYNGYGFDSPYLAGRSKKLGLNFPPSGKLIKSNRNFVRSSFYGIFGPENSPQIFLPGIEQLDLVLYIKKFHPGLPNNKLDTVGTKFLGVGKTGLTIPELNRFYQIGDPEGLKIGGEYALQDSILLANLQEKLQIDNRLERLANMAGITTEDVLKLNDQDIIDRILFQLDPGLYFWRGKVGESPYLSLAKPGLYHPQVYIYDYSPFYIKAMIESKNSLNLKIAIVLSDAYPSLIYKLFYSKVLDRSVIDQLLYKYLIGIKSTTIFSRTEYLISSLTPLNFPKDDIYQPILVAQYQGLLSITKTNYITLDDKNNLVRYGYSEICNPPFPLASQVIDQYLKHFFGIGPALTNIQIGPDTPIEQLVMNDKIKDKSSYQSNKSSFRKTLAEQYNDPISTWIRVDWVQTSQGPMLLSKFQIKLTPVTIFRTTGQTITTPPLSIDYNWYANRLNTLLQKISDLPIYQPI